MILLLFLQLKRSILHFQNLLLFINIIKKKREKHLFKKIEIRFIDSFKFLQTSLANLVSNLQPSDFSNLQNNIKNNSSLLARKGTFILTIMLHQLNNSKKQNFPPKKHFIQNFSMKKFQMKIINMLSMFGILSVVKLFKTITIFISKLMFFFWLMFLRISEKHV